MTLNGERVTQFWSHCTMFLAGVVITLVGAWATHSVTKEELADAINNSERIQNVKMDAINSNQRDLINRLDEIRRDMQTMKQVAKGQ